MAAARNSLFLSSHGHRPDQHVVSIILECVFRRSRALRKLFALYFVTLQLFPKNSMLTRLLVLKYGTRNTSPGAEGPVQASMPPPLVAMAASKLKLQGPQDQLREKDKFICALQADKQSYLAAAAEEASKGEYGKMNRGWRKHNAMPHKPVLITRGKEATKDEKSSINMEKVFLSPSTYLSWRKSRS